MQEKRFIEIWRGCGRMAIGPLFLFKTGMTLTFSSKRSVSVWLVEKHLRWSINKRR